MHMKTECSLPEGSPRTVPPWGTPWTAPWGLRSEGSEGTPRGWSGGPGCGPILSRGAPSSRTGYWPSYPGTVLLLWCLHNLHRSDYMLNMLAMKCWNVEQCNTIGCDPRVQVSGTFYPGTDPLLWCPHNIQRCVFISQWIHWSCTV